MIILKNKNKKRGALVKEMQKAGKLVLFFIFILLFARTSAPTADRHHSIKLAFQAYSVK